MKYISTKANIVCRYGMNNIISVGYCDLQDLLAECAPEAYTSGVYGWNADIYNVNGTAICTGYRPFGGISPDYETVRRYNAAARDLRVSRIEEIYHSGLDAEETYQALKALRRDLRAMAVQFVAEVTA